MMQASLPRSLPSKRGRGRPTKANQIAIQDAASSRQPYIPPLQNFPLPEISNILFKSKATESFQQYLALQDKKYTLTSKKLAVLPSFVDQSNCAHFFFTYTTKEKTNSAIFLTFTENIAYVSILSKEFKFDKDDPKMINIINQLNSEDFRYSAHIVPVVKNTSLNEETKEEIKKPVTLVSKSENTHNLLFIQRVFYSGGDIKDSTWWSFVIEIIKKYQHFLNIYSRNYELDSKGQCQKKRKIYDPSFIIHKNASELNEIVINSIKNLGFSSIKQKIVKETYIALIAITYENDNIDQILSTFPVVFESKSNFITLKLIAAIHSKVINFEYKSYDKINYFLSLANSKCDYGFFNLDTYKSQVYFKVSQYFEGIENRTIENYIQEMISMAIYYYKIFSFGILKLHNEHKEYNLEKIERLFKYCESKIKNIKLEPFTLDNNSVDSKGKNATTIEESYEISDPRETVEVIEKLKGNEFLCRVFEAQTITIRQKNQNFEVRQVLPPGKQLIKFILEGDSSYIQQIELLYLELSRVGLFLSELPIDNCFISENMLKVKYNLRLQFIFNPLFTSETELLVDLHREIRKYIFTQINSSKKYSNYREFNGLRNFEPDAMDIDEEIKDKKILEKILCNRINNSKIHYDTIENRNQESILILWKYNSILSSDNICRLYGSLDNGDSLSLVYESYETNAFDYFASNNLENGKLSKNEAESLLRELIKALLLIKTKNIPIFAFDPEMVMLPGDSKIKLRLKAENLVNEEWKSDRLKQEAIDESGLYFSLGLFLQYMIHGNTARIDRTRCWNFETFHDALNIISDHISLT